MKHWLTALCVSALAGVTSPSAHSRDVISLPSPARIRVDVQMVSIPVAEAGRLIPAFQDRKTSTEAWTRLQAMITNGEASLIGWPALWLQNGQRGVFESIGEDRYPTDFNPPQGPAESFFGRRLILPAGVPYTPTAFETRNTGCTLEADANVEKDGKVIALDLVAQYARRIGTREWHTQPDRIGISGVQQQPEFRTSKIMISLDVRRDEPTLVGTFVVTEPQPHVELFILHAKATMLPAGAFPPPAK